ncbi:DUF2653 family protein [Alicyclobacillus macrosporangiidus]|uniref:DUF2653 family protein n=1 Tax=Alicyclobacillus macrosporangiidus TaxID=392015 RepID=UPI001E63E89E|nr:DUF2653 family protein [Alicyclobacillus macrosporangiidus]
MRRWVLTMAACLLLVQPTVADAATYRGGSTYSSRVSSHATFSGGEFGSGSAYHSSYTTPSSSTGSVSGSRATTGSSAGTTVGSGSSYRSGYTAPSSSAGTTAGSSSTYHSGYQSPSPNVRTPTSGYSSGTVQRPSLSAGHVAAFGAGMLLGSMLHPFGWGWSAPYTAAPAYASGVIGAAPAGMAAAASGWSWVGTILDLILLAAVVLAVVALVRRRRKKRAGVFATVSSGAAGDSGAGMAMYLDEQAMVDACCEYVARREGCPPQQVEVDLQFDNGRFAADARIGGWRHRHLSQQDLVDAVAEFVAERESVSPHRVRVDLQFSEQNGVTADAVVV